MLQNGLGVAEVVVKRGHHSGAQTKRSLKNLNHRKVPYFAVHVSADVHFTVTLRFAVHRMDTSTCVLDFFYS